MKPAYLVALTMTAVTTVGCSGSSTGAPPSSFQPSTTTGLPPTSVRATIAVPVPGTETVVAPSESVPTNAADDDGLDDEVLDDDGLAKAAVVARYDALSEAANGCLGAPDDCDVPSVLSDYADPDASLSRYYERRWRGLIEKDWTVQNLDQSERWPNSVHVEADYAVVVGCVIDRGVVVDANGDVINDETSYREEETVWNLVDNQWRLVGGQTYGIGSTSGSICEF